MQRDIFTDKVGAIVWVEVGGGSIIKAKLNHFVLKYINKFIVHMKWLYCMYGMGYLLGWSG